jgi:hypothetical protein
MFFDRYEIHIQASLDFIDGKFIIFRSSSSQKLKFPHYLYRKKTTPAGWGGGRSTGKSFRSVRACVRAVWLPSGIGAQCVWAVLFPFPFWSRGAFPFPFWAQGAFPFPFPPPSKPPIQL